MTYRGKFIVAIISLGVAVYAFSGVLLGWYNGGTSAQQPINDPGAQIRIFESVLQHIQNDYVDEPDLEKVRNGALRGLADGLDPYTSYLTAEQVNEYKSGNTNGRIGIGAEFSQVSGYLYVIAVTKGSPADEAGLRSGDVIEYVDTKATRDISLYDAKQLVLGAKGTKVKLRVLRTGAKPRTIEVTRSDFTVPKPDSSVKDGGIGVIRVHSLNGGESKNIEKEIASLKSKGIKKLILDLRNVAGGSLEEAVAVANLFIREGELATVVGRENKVISTFSADPSKAMFDGEAVVLIDLGTAGAGEVVASAFIDRKRGEVVGEKSFGAGTTQELFTLKGGDGFLLTTAKWASASGSPFLSSKRDDAGVTPTVEVKRPETPEPVEVEELVEQQDEDGDPEDPVEEVPPAPVEEKPSKPKQDQQMQKALELLKGKASAAGA